MRNKRSKIEGENERYIAKERKSSRKLGEERYGIQMTRMTTFIS